MICRHQVSRPGRVATGRPSRRRKGQGHDVKSIPITLHINEETHEVLVRNRDTLLEVLREKLSLTGTKEACGTGECGACTVLIDGAPVLACLTLAIEVQGRKITTIEGLSADGKLTRMQRVFIEHGAVQCGFCTPGMILTATSLLANNPGVSAYFTGTLIYPNSSAAIVSFNDDGTAVLLTGAHDIGQGAETILCQIVAEKLGLAMEEIRVVAADTKATPVDIGSWISGLTYVTGNAVKKAAEEARRMLLAAAAKELECGPDDLEARDRRVFIKETDTSISFARAIARHIRDNGGDPIIGRSHFRGLKEAAIAPSLKNAKGSWTDSYAFDAQVAEVEVDTMTGRITVTRALTSHDCGFPINPLNVEGQIDGQVSMAAGQVISEEVIMKDGITLNPSFLNYELPSPRG